MTNPIKSREIIENIEKILENDHEIVKSRENDHDHESVQKDLDHVIVVDDRDLEIVIEDRDHDRKIGIVIEDLDRAIVITPISDHPGTAEITGTTIADPRADRVADPDQDRQEINSVVHDPRSTRQNCWQLPRKTPLNF